MAKRKEIEQYIIDSVHKIAPDGHNKKLYEELFSKMNNNEFHDFMLKLKNKEINIAIIAPPGENTLSVERNLKLAKEFGVKFFQRITYGPSADVPKYTTDIPYMVCDYPFRRARQTLSKGLSVTKNSVQKDMLTGQVTGDSKSAKLTLPEAQIVSGMNMDATLRELMKIRGGDMGGGKAMDAFFSKYGSATQQNIEPHASGVVSTDTLNAFFKAAHIRGNF